MPPISGHPHSTINGRSKGLEAPKNETTHQGLAPDLEEWDEERDGFIDPWFDLSDEEQDAHLREVVERADKDVAEEVPPRTRGPLNIEAVDPAVRCLFRLLGAAAASVVWSAPSALGCRAGLCFDSPLGADDLLPFLA
jgi:hypothetical protein